MKGSSPLVTCICSRPCFEFSLFAIIPPLATLQAQQILPHILRLRFNGDHITIKIYCPFGRHPTLLIIPLTILLSSLSFTINCNFFDVLFSLIFSPSYELPFLLSGPIQTISYVWRVESFSRLLSLILPLGRPRL